jgi:hypothetical protein
MSCQDGTFLVDSGTVYLYLIKTIIGFDIISQNIKQFTLIVLVRQST